MTTSQGGLSSRRSMSLTHSSSQSRRRAAAAAAAALENVGGGAGGGAGDSSSSSRKSLSTSRSIFRRICNRGLNGERTVKRLRLSRALTVPETTTIKEACHKMAARRVDALLLTDSNALLCGILTDKDIATRVIAREINLDETPVSKVMTRNPVFVLSDTLAVEALQKMVQGKFRHLPVVENGEVIALLDITKCLYDAIARMERAAEKGKAIAAAVEGVEKQWGTSVSGPNTFIETLRERIFRPSVSTIIPENSKIATVDPSDTVLAAAKKILELRTSSAVVTVENKPRGILTSKDMLMRVIAQNLPPESTTVEQVMTPNPECATLDSPIVDALHTMHDGKFLHLPVIDKDGTIVAVIDVLHITQSAVATVGNSGGGNSESANMLMQSFWDSAMALTPDDEEETLRYENSLKMPSDVGETGRSIPQQPSLTTSNTFSFKIQDRKGRMHRFISDTQNVTELITAILQRIGAEIDRNNPPQIVYEDEDNDKVVLASDSDLQAAVYHAKLAGWKVLTRFYTTRGLRLHLDYLGGLPRNRKGSKMEYAEGDGSASSAYSAVAAGAALIACLGFYAYLRRLGK
ncbi:PREDICTED: CBS domain-containing protein CBSCBSPB1-like [Erythranthe guttata]|uniref:CBS domain-containing protein CBSCBSPB1-like n=1 Tax=Erythranthe guttata TaxID=4155 RepID=UPI00064E1087|nr:PREDICTED: CBS domain-containing protein CBSCBSPB1-like [Erythranthe guttata]|eukprot:XP_012830539.1 PREDICTED: CBS domain-containing protein CBSCBSPB1-like [Erythranthe guttata]